MSVRIDGQPAGSHSFEIAGADANGGRLTLDQVFKHYAPSIAKIRRLDKDGRPIDSSHGFVIGPNAVATSFQSIDAADAIEAEFGDGRKVPVTSTWAVSRRGDWAIVNVDTAGVAAIPRGEAPPIGTRVATFDTDGGAMVIVAVDIGGVGPSPNGTTRIRFGPPVTLGALGGPLLDDRGTATGLIGGTLTPGLRAPAGPTTCSVPSSWINLSRSTASLVSDVGYPGLDANLTHGFAAEPRADLSPRTHAGVRLRWHRRGSTPKDSANRVIHEITEFSRRDNKPILAYAYWSTKAKLSKGDVSVALFDADNRQKDVSPPKKVSLNSSPQRFFASWASKDLAPGFYRVDFLWDGTPVWRTYFHVSD